MSDLSEGLQALSGRAGIAERNERMQQFRADFKTVEAWYRKAGYSSQDEYERDYSEGVERIKAMLGNQDKLGPVMEAYRVKAEEIERDIARSVRIKAERAEEKMKGEKHG